MKSRSRIYIAGAIAPFAVALVLVPVAGAKAVKKQTKGTVAASCTVTVSTAVPAGQTVILPSAAQGDQWGRIHCGGKKFGEGAYEDSFTTPDTGIVMGSYRSYFGTGAIRGTFVLEPQVGTLGTGTGTGTFAFVSYTGTVKVTGGTGTYSGAKGTGTITATSQDGIHFTWTEKLELTKL